MAALLKSKIAWHWIGIKLGAVVLTTLPSLSALAQARHQAPWERTPSPHGLADAQEVRHYFSNRTKLSYSSGHGTQVEYSSADGRVFLWYPGNRAVVSGRWRVEEIGPVIVRQEGNPAEPGKPRKLAKVCFQYGPNTYNPVTQHQGGGWECTLYGSLKATARESRSGDVFNLANGKIPFVLLKEEATIEALLKRSRR